MPDTYRYVVNEHNLQRNHNYWSCAAQVSDSLTVRIYCSSSLIAAKLFSGYYMYNAIKLIKCSTMVNV